MFGSLANNVGTSKSQVWFAVFVVALLRKFFSVCCCFFFPVCVFVCLLFDLFLNIPFFPATSSFSLFFFWFILSVHRDVVVVVVAEFYCCVPFWCPFCRSVQAKAWRHIPFHLCVYAHFCFSFLCVRFRCVSAVVCNLYSSCNRVAAHISLHLLNERKAK